MAEYRHTPNQCGVKDGVRHGVWNGVRHGVWNGVRHGVVTEAWSEVRLCFPKGR